MKITLDAIVIYLNSKFFLGGMPPDSPRKLCYGPVVNYLSTIHWDTNHTG